MTDIELLAEELSDSVNQQRVPEEVTQFDLAKMIVEAIKDLYVISGRALLWSDDKIGYDNGSPYIFEDTLK